MTAAEHPTLMTRLAAAMRGEVAATTVEAYRRAGAAAYQDLADAEQLRGGLAASGGSMWTARPDQASQLLCAWNAFALLTLGDELVEADYQADPRTAGYLPPVTAEQAAAFLGEVEHWSARRQRRDLRRHGRDRRARGAAGMDQSRAVPAGAPVRDAGGGPGDARPC